MARSKKNRSSAGAGDSSTGPAGRPDDAWPRPAAGREDERLVTRRDMAGWVGGTERPGQLGRWPGDRLGLAKDGPTSMAGWGRRLIAVLIDWFAAGMVSALWFGSNPLATLAVFAALHVVLLWLFGTTLGKWVGRIQVVRVGGAPLVSPVKPLIRTVLLCLVVPPLLLDGDGRGLHDRVAGTVQIRM